MMHASDTGDLRRGRLACFSLPLLPAHGGMGTEERRDRPSLSRFSPQPYALHPPFTIHESPMPTALSSWIHRLVLGGLLLAAYLFAWTPARTAWTEHGAALLVHVVPAETTVSARPATHTIRLSSADGRSTTYTAPAGVKFLLPGLFLLLIAPARPRLVPFFVGHLLLGALALGLLMVGSVSLPGGFGLARFVQTYGVDAYSLAVPVFVFARRKRVGNGE